MESGLVRRWMCWVAAVAVLAGCASSATESPAWRHGDVPADLGVPIERAHYFTNVTATLGLDEDAVAKLRSNGFVVVGGGDKDIRMMYRLYWVNDLPVFVSADTMLHAHHLMFDEMLQSLETEALLPAVREMSKVLLREAVAVRGQAPQALRGPVDEAVVFFGVAASLLGDRASVPVADQDEVDKIVASINAAQGFTDQDWTQYKPRGHYDTEELRPYFRAMMWYGRTQHEMERADDVASAAVIATILDGSQRGKELWERVYGATEALIGRSDSLTPQDLARAIKESVGAVDAQLLAIPGNLAKVQKELDEDGYYRQRILSTILMVDPGQALDGRPVNFPLVHQFMGQRYVLDSDILQQVMYDRAPLHADASGELQRRGLPSGLDVAAALGSGRARELLAAELERYGYGKQLDEATAAVAGLAPGEWTATAYAGHLDLLRARLRPVPAEAPAVAQTKAWADLRLNSALGSWAELRHDTILYAKQPYSVGITCSTPEAWVDPDPAVFAALRDLATRIQATVAGFADIAPGAAARLGAAYQDLADISARLSTIAQAELDGKDLPAEDITWLREIFHLSEGAYGMEVSAGWLPVLLAKAGVDPPDAHIVADVATDPGADMPRPSPPQVLHVGLGDFQHAVVAYEQDGEWHVAVGPVYSYHEFAEQGLSRLNDDEWSARLAAGEATPPPWTSSFLA